MHNKLFDNSKFISFEGIDYSGKTTQINHLTTQLREKGEQVLVLREPGGTQISEKIRDILLDSSHPEMTNICEILLYSAARHQLVAEKVTKQLESGNFVIADRYVDSTSAYQGYGRKIPFSFVNQLNRFATDGLMPKMTFFLDLTPSEIQLRKKSRNKSADRLEQGGLQFYERIRKGYYELAEKYKERIIVIDASRQIDQIKKEIWEFVESKMKLK